MNVRLAACRSLRLAHPRHTRSFFGLFKRKEQRFPESKPLLSEDNLFHPFSKSPFPAIRARGEAIKQLAPCPVCSSSHEHAHAHTTTQPKALSFECPDCGWPTHCSEEHWAADQEHQKYCSRLREVNEDEHDLRSGRKLQEFDLPGPQDFETAISFANWDVFWYTRGFPSMNTERSRRHSSKLLTYPITIGSVLHQFSGLTLSNQRLTSEGSRSLAALRTTLHVKPGTPETEESGSDKPQVRLFVLGARAESSLPPHAWEQLCMLFPSALLHLHFIGPQVSLPKPADEMKRPTKSSPSTSTSSTEQKGTSASSSPQPTPNSEPSTSAPTSTSPTPPAGTEEKSYVPNVYEPPTPAPIARLNRTREEIEIYGVPSYTVPYTHQLTITGMQANYMEVHHLFRDTFDPYTDAFVLFSPGFGFPSPTSVDENGNPVLQIVSPTEWGPVIPELLATKCPIFVTGFSPADVERDARSLSNAPGVAGEFDWVITPGENEFGSIKWEVADFDPRVMVKTNWGVWGIRGKTREIREKSWFGL